MILNTDKFYETLEGRFNGKTMIFNPKLFLLFFLNVGIGYFYFQVNVNYFPFNTDFLIFLKSSSELDQIRVDPQEVYQYEHFYQIERTEGSKSSLFNYHLNKESFALSINKDITNTCRIFDEKQKLIFSFFQLDEESVYNHGPLDHRSKTDWVDSRYNQSTFDLTEMPNKEFLGHTSTGKRLENKEWIFTLYYLSDTSIAHPDIIGSSGSFLDKEEEWVLMQHIEEVQKNLLMYLDIKNKETEEIIVEARAQSLKQEVFTFKTTDYKLVHQ